MIESTDRTVRTPEADGGLWSSQSLYLCRLDGSCALTRMSPGFDNLIRSSGAAPPAELTPLIHPEDREDFLADLAGVLENGSVLERRIVRLVLPDGRVMLMEVIAEPSRDGDDGPGAILAWWERSGNEAVISWTPSEEHDLFLDLLKNFISSFNDAVVLLSTEARIIHVNARFQDMTGYHRGEIIGSPVARLFEKRPERVQGAMMKFARAMRHGQMKDTSTSWVTSSGEFTPVTMSGALIRTNSGELMGMVLVGRDETRNALLADLDRKNQELEQANRELKRLDSMKDDVLSLVGHELRAPLSNILGYAEFISEWDIGDKEKKEYARVIYQESQHLRRLVNDILDLSRLEAGRMAYSFITDSINRVARATVDALKVDLDKSSTSVEFELDDQVEPLEFDPDKVQQVISNIIHNAVKFSGNGKTLRIRTEAVEGGVRVAITDQGIGIARANRDKVFQKFGQIIGVKHHSEGAGLGMPIARAIVEQGHGGRLWFESEGEGKGTTFLFVLPERRPE